jgi:hypothetical protein
MTLDKEAEVILLNVYGIRFGWTSQSTSNHVFTIAGTNHSFKGKPGELLENTYFLENVEKLKRVMKLMENCEILANEYKAVLGKAGLEEVPFGQFHYDGCLLTMEEIDELIGSL